MHSVIGCLFIYVYICMHFSSCLLPCLHPMHLTGDLKLSAATVNSLRAGIGETRGKLSVRRKKKVPLVSGTHVGFLCTYAPHTASYLPEQVHTDDCRLH